MTYSIVEKTKFVEALLESGMNATQASREAGWPSRNLLRKWLREAEEGKLAVRVPVPKGYTGKRSRHTRYSNTTKVEAIKLYMMGRRPSDIARLLGINCPSVIYQWWKRTCAEGKLPRDTLKQKQITVVEVVPMRKKKDVPPEVAALSEAELENACLRAVLADLKVGGWDLDSISNRKKAELGVRLKAETGRALQEIIAFLKISKSSYNYHVRAMKRADKYAGIQTRICRLFWENKGVYGYRRIWANLRAQGIRVSEKVVRRIMKECSLVALCEKKAKQPTTKGELHPEADNLVKRSFHAPAPNMLWLTDISEFSIPQGKVYLSAMVDCFDGALASWTIGRSPNACLVNTMLDKAIDTLEEGQHPIVHSDQAGHYRWPGWIERMEKAKLSRSMSRKGCPQDNAACEGLFGRIKNEMFYQRSWENVSLHEFIDILDEYLHWYNEKRIKKSLGYLSPLQYRRQLGLVA
jgi:transposase InsO family protein/transposase-like protein